MSWTAYAEKLVADKAGEAAGIVGLNGAPWGVAGGFNISAAEATAFANAFANPSSLHAAGAYINGVKYMIISIANDVIQLKKGKGGAVVAKSVQCMVITTFGEESNIEQRSANTTVCQFVDKLKPTGY
eukprot:TRINITY_DN87019_c0_g1_i1.p2 TRINITY_DN87019_c0_g1~~TRINITY_DN87019_c0_g1_i1.p2  ORF type:complete len:128 (+),score=30.31 TRINITY_DN87019_c0_g1_i1:31-414(+)